MTDIKEHNLYLDQGTTFLTCVYINALDDDFDLDDYTFHCKFGKIYSSYDKTTLRINPVITEDDKNLVELHLDTNSSIDIKPGKYVYDVIMSNINTNTNDKILKGLLFVLETITIIKR